VDADKGSVGWNVAFAQCGKDMTLSLMIAQRGYDVLMASEETKSMGMDFEPFLNEGYEFRNSS
jgi:hypothetical protein